MSLHGASGRLLALEVLLERRQQTVAIIDAMVPLVNCRTQPSLLR